VSSETYHEPYELLSDESKDRHRAILSLMEELEAIDWYQQRADVSGDESLKAVLLHNKNEEIEHAMMTLEWLRRRDPVFAVNADTYLFTEGAITEIEKNEEKGEGTKKEKPKGNEANDGSLGIGSLRG
jgi:uncharacterized protein